MGNNVLQSTYEHYLDALKRSDRRGALGIVKEALAAGCDVRDIYISVFQPAMYQVGWLWEVNQFTVAQEHLATAITQSVMAHIYNELFLLPHNGRAVVATCIGGELHELGIRMVADFFEMEGWDVYYLGANVPSDSLISMIEERKADLIAISVTIPHHMSTLRVLIAKLRQTPSCKRLKIMVGGQPINHSGETAASLGADYMARDAREAITLARDLLK